MTIVGPFFRWDAPVGRFRMIETGQFVAAVDVAPWLKVSGGAIRDSLGQYVPWEYAGGSVSREFPTGSGDMVAITRNLPVGASDMPVRPQEMLRASITYSVDGERQEMAYAGYPKGKYLVDFIAEEVVAVAVTGQFRYTTGEEVAWEDVDVEDIEWALTTFYEDGSFLGGDYGYFEGMQSA